MYNDQELFTSNENNRRIGQVALFVGNDSFDTASVRTLATHLIDAAHIGVDGARSSERVPSGHIVDPEQYGWGSSDLMLIAKESLTFADNRQTDGGVQIHGNRFEDAEAFEYWLRNNSLQPTLTENGIFKNTLSSFGSYSMTGNGWHYNAGLYWLFQQRTKQLRGRKIQATIPLQAAYQQANTVVVSPAARVVAYDQPLPLATTFEVTPSDPSQRTFKRVQFAHRLFPDSAPRRTGGNGGYKNEVPNSNRAGVLLWLSAGSHS